VNLLFGIFADWIFNIDVNKNNLDWKSSLIVILFLWYEPNDFVAILEFFIILLVSILKKTKNFLFHPIFDNNKKKNREWHTESEKKRERNKKVEKLKSWSRTLIGNKTVLVLNVK
jgi:hypothetical protein